MGRDTKQAYFRIQGVDEIRLDYDEKNQDCVLAIGALTLRGEIEAMARIQRVIWRTLDSWEG